MADTMQAVATLGANGSCIYFMKRLKTRHKDDAWWPSLLLTHLGVFRITVYTIRRNRRTRNTDANGLNYTYSDTSRTNQIQPNIFMQNVMFNKSRK
jgi:hypothetical protein